MFFIGVRCFEGSGRVKDLQGSNRWTILEVQGLEHSLNTTCIITTSVLLLTPCRLTSWCVWEQPGPGPEHRPRRGPDLESPNPLSLQKHFCIVVMPNEGTEFTDVISSATHALDSSNNMTNTCTHMHAHARTRAHKCSSTSWQCTECTSDWLMNGWVRACVTHRRFNAE